MKLHLFSMYNLNCKLAIIILFAFYHSTIIGQSQSAEIPDGIYFLRPINCEFVAEVRSTCEDQDECIIQLNKYSEQATRNKFILRKLGENKYMFYTYSSRNILNIKSDKLGGESKFIFSNDLSLTTNINSIDSCHIWKIFKPSNSSNVYYIKTLCGSNRYMGILKGKSKKRRTPIELFDIQLDSKNAQIEWIFLKTDTLDASAAKARFKHGRELPSAIK